MNWDNLFTPTSNSISRIKNLDLDPGSKNRKSEFLTWMTLPQLAVSSTTNTTSLMGDKLLYLARWGIDVILSVDILATSLL